MKSRIVFGALIMSVALCGQGFGFELLDNLLGQKNCGSRGCCEPACCEQACQPNCCEKTSCAPQACEPQCCEADCGTSCKKSCDLFGGLRGLFACKSSCNSCCEPEACGVVTCAPEPKCCETACAPKCCETDCGPQCCEADCGTSCCKPRCTPVLDFLEDLCSLRICLYKAEKSCGGCCDTGCGDTGCCEEATCGGCGGSGAAPATQAAPKAAPKEKAAPLPKAPKADSSAQLRRTSRYHQAGRVVVRN